MANPPGISTGIGFRACRLFALDVNGYPAAPAATVYDGVRITGNRTLTVNMPEPRKVPYIGDDGVFDLDSLPAQEADSAELRAGKYDFDVDELISGGPKKFAVGDFTMFPTGTEAKGFEPQVGLMAYRQAKVEDPASVFKGQRVWQSLFMPKVQLISRGTGWQDTQEEHVYSLVPAYCAKHLWGTALAAVTEGVVQAQMTWGLSFYKPKLCAFKGDATVVLFVFTATAQAVNANYSVWLNGVIQTTGVTKAVTGVTFTVAPPAGAMIVVLYETA